jgi:hypothetical protein
MLFGWEIGLEVDCWAFGAVLIWMITGKVRYTLELCDYCELISCLL